LTGPTPSLVPTFSSIQQNIFNADDSSGRDASDGNSRRAASAPVSLPVQTTPEADAQILEIDEWWRRNRLASPDLFFDELTASFDTIRHTPQIGRLLGHLCVCDRRRR
jgi:hypothetical protein